MKKFWEYVDDYDGDWDKSHTPIRINRGRYRGMVYVYGRVEFPTSLNEKGRLNLKFSYQILENPKSKTISRNLIDTMGDILVEIIDENCEDMEATTPAQEMRKYEPEEYNLD